MAADRVQKTALRGIPRGVPLRAVMSLVARLSLLVLLASPAALAAPKHRAQAESHEPADGGKTHVVAPGQTIGKIAKRYHVSVEQLRETNDLRPGVTLKPGTRLTIPADDVPSDRSTKKTAAGKGKDKDSSGKDAADDRTDGARAKAGQDRNDRDSEGDAADEPADGKKGHGGKADKKAKKGKTAAKDSDGDEPEAKKGGKADDAADEPKGKKGKTADKKAKPAPDEDEPKERKAHGKTRARKTKA